MVKKNPVATYVMQGMIIVLSVLALILLGILLWRTFTISSAVENDNKNKDSVCMSTKEYERLMAMKEQQAVPQCRPSAVQPQPQTRDRRVLNDPLYPPLNRTDTVTHEMLETQIDRRNMYVPINDNLDNFRLVGYLINKDPNGARDAGGNNWKLFARQKDRNISDFYMIPSNNNYDIKINIKDDMVVGDRFRDVYTIPTQVRFNSPMLNDTPYDFVEIPKADLASSTRYM